MLPQSRRVLLCESRSLYVGVVKFLLPSQADSTHVNRQHVAGLDLTFSGPPCLGDEETVPRPFGAPLQAFHRKQEAASRTTKVRLVCLRVFFDDLFFHGERW